MGKKLVTTVTPRLNGLSPGQGNPGTQITITGMAFDGEQNGSLITMDGRPLQPQVEMWADAQIQFTLPKKLPSEKDWTDEQRVDFGVIVGGQESVNSLPFTVKINEE